MVQCFGGSGDRSAPRPKRVVKLPDVSVKLTAPEKLAGRTRPAGSLVSLSESRAARLIAAGHAEMPGKPSARLTAMVAEFRQFDAFMAKRQAGVQFATAF